MSSYRIFAGVTAGVSALILVLTQVVGGTEESAAPELEPLPTVAPSPIDSPAPEPSLPSPSPTPDEPPPEIGTVLYEHDFSSPQGGLLEGASSDTGTNEFGTRLAEYTDRGTLSITTRSELATYVGGATTERMVVGGVDLENLGDVSIETDAAPIDLGTGAAWGLVCRRDRDVGRFYFAFVSDAGGHAGAGIIRQDSKGGAWAEVATANALPAGVTIGEGSSNRLRLDCIGSTLTLFADGQEVLQGTDSTYSSGSLALFVNPLAAGEEASATVEFDNLVIREAD